MSIFDDLKTPLSGQLTLKLASNTKYGNWSWVKDSDSKFGLALEGVANLDISNIKKSKYFEIKIVKVPNFGNLLTIICVSSEFNSIFEVLCRNLIESCEFADDVVGAFELVVGRIAIWIKLFSKGFRGLSILQVYGLAAELEFLNLLLLNSIPNAINSWRGPLGSAQDFIFPNLEKAIEVKTTSISNDQVFISSFEQLDFDGQLYLMAFSVLRSNETSLELSNLDSIVSKINSKLSNSEKVEFDKLLMHAGYLPDYYKDVHFLIDHPRPFKISTGFPRIFRSAVQPAIMAIKYQIDLAKCANYKIALVDLVGGLS
jgi:hypothetical protein